MSSHQLKPKRAVVYYRSARSDVDDSIQKQRALINTFTTKEKIEIVHEAIDEGVSGHRAYRPGLSRLFNEWICNPAATTFEYVLMQDVSRWGRFLDPSNILYWEYLCRRHGKKVIYVADVLSKENSNSSEGIHFWRNLIPKRLIPVTTKSYEHATKS